MAIIFTLLTAISTFFGGIFSIKNRKKLHLILGFTAGVLLAVVAFDLLPEIIRLLEHTHSNPDVPMIALVVAFLLFHILEKTFLIHHSQEESYSSHHHPSVGLLSALALSGHSFFDGVGIGLGFQISSTTGVIIAIAVIAHDFTDGLNTATLMLINNNSIKRAIQLLVLDSITPTLGAISTLFFKLPEKDLLIYLGFFAGFLLYIGCADILPEAHSEHSSYKTILMTLLGTLFIFIVTRFI